MEYPIRRYLEDAIAAEKSFETQLRGFAEEATYPGASMAFATHSAETKVQHERLTARLRVLGGEPSTIKSALAHLFNMAPHIAQIGHEAEERTTQDLIMAYSMENAEVAMYQAMAVAAEPFDDTETAELARSIQQQERETASKVWKLIGPSAEQAYLKAISGDSANAAPTIARYLQDAEAAERNFETALASFSKTGDQPEVRSLLAMMSAKARTQHERLQARLHALGGGTSTGKSILGHMLAFPPVTAQMGYAASEKNAQHLMITFAAASAEMGMYEALACAAAVSGDQETAALARELQAEEKRDHELAWEHLEQSARTATLEAARR